MSGKVIPLSWVCCGGPPGSGAGGWAPAGTAGEPGTPAGGAPTAAADRGRSWASAPVSELPRGRGRMRGTVLWAPGKAWPRNFIFSCPHHGPCWWTLWSHGLPHAPSGQDPLFLGAPGSRRLWAGLSAARPLLPVWWVPSSHTVGSQGTCWAPGPVLQADGQLKSGREAEPE